MKKYYLGIELGSTRIKAVLIDDTFTSVASGDHAWENKLENNIWTYSLDAVKAGVQDAYARLKDDFEKKTGTPLTQIDHIGISAMMHGFLAFDKDMQLLTPFRTWRNTNASYAAEILSQLFNFKIPMRWSIAHLYHAIISKESFVKDIAHMTTLAGYVHYMLTGEKILGIGDASGVFPIDSKTGTYDAVMKEKFEKLTDIDITKIFPKALNAGEPAGKLTAEGAAFLDPSNTLKPGAALCPPEGDAGTGMVATNSVAPRTGNISAGTSIFAMLVLENPLKRAHPEIDIVTTPCAKPVAMVHGNTCTSDLDAWINMFGEAAEALGADVDKNKLYTTLYNKALEGASDAGKLLNYNFYSGEPVAYVHDGCPLFLRDPSNQMTLADFMRVQIYSSLAVLKLGIDILADENVKIDSLKGHGGLFKVKDVGQKLTAAALGIPITISTKAAEGGAWGIALLASFASHKAGGGSDILEDYLANKVFSDTDEQCVEPDPKDKAGFESFIKRYNKGLPLARQVYEVIK